MIRRISPNHDRLQSLNGTWRDINGMPSLVSIPGDDRIVANLGIADLSFLTRFGVKGAGAVAWLESQKLEVPDRANTWKPLPDGGIIARLGLTEFLIEDSLHSSFALRLAEACQSVPAKVYPVLRQDAAIVLCGKAIQDLLRQTCSVNFQALSLAEHPVILTLMVGVSVTIIPILPDRYRIWCDGTFGAYLWETLLTIAQELGGGVVGVDRLI
ncbi:methylglutamate dehydrogenase [Phormidesmis priestleyi ULC007]|uniref:Methylglutamate dehydrogenase n=1 Tax=Phormidesmis priestleyi ULC007 TaxID=1920490 RepID=A0A2T1DN53_9CYAN|nr:methylglutamate dehydrogenase [Phormidesmis priestleyi]PSB21892.1 methylglutamate dehydrogenase [Phormidesmis priestleyi ULC007]PZO50548.1 MAG: methylglutamate dehydrogenase [Phormidesmis priestleyi]